MAAALGHIVVSLLLEAGADPERRDNLEGSTPLIHCARLRTSSNCRALGARRCQYNDSGTRCGLLGHTAVLCYTLFRYCYG